MLAEPIGPHAIHLCVDMQRMFADATDWHTPTLAAILPNVVRIATARPDRTLFARFTVPTDADDARGRWRRYHRRWSKVAGDVAEQDLVALVPALEAVAVPHGEFDKATYSAFGSADLSRRLADRETDTLILTGVETDICVLATVFDAVDLGYRVVVVGDAVASSSIASHRAVLDLLLPRMPEQVEIVATRDLLEDWLDPAVPRG